MALTPLTGAATATVKVGDFNALVSALNTELDILRERQGSMEAQLGGRITALESAPGNTPPDLTDRVTAVEAAVAGLAAPAPAVAIADPMPAVAAPSQRRVRDNADGVEMVYDKATLYYGDMELHAVRIGETTWRLVAQLNYITVNQVLWTYDETIEGTTDDVYRHAAGRLEELAELKVTHDAVHDRVRQMSGGEP